MTNTQWLYGPKTEFDCNTIRPNTTCGPQFGASVKVGHPSLRRFCAVADDAVGCRRWSTQLPIRVQATPSFSRSHARRPNRSSDQYCQHVCRLKPLCAGRRSRSRVLSDFGMTLVIADQLRAKESIGSVRVRSSGSQLYG